MTTEQIDIKTQLAAMDAIDAARSEEELLNDEINIDFRKNALKDKLRKTYAAQNITVSEEILERGVKDFFEHRHEFRPMTRNFNILAAWLYINRAKLFKNTSLFCVFCLSIFVTYWAVGVGIKSYQKSAEQRKIAAQKEAELAEVARVKAAELAEIKRRNEETLRKKTLTEELVKLSEKILATGETIRSLAKEPRVGARTGAILQEGIGAIKAENIAGARQAYAALQGILNNISQEYSLVINQSGGRVGFWRTSHNNPARKRYYIVVNAVDSQNIPVELEIKNEEDGSAKKTSQWAEQVSEAEFETIKAERVNSGAIANPVFAKKEKGYLYPDYSRGLKHNQTKYEAEALRITRW